MSKDEFVPYWAKQVSDEFDIDYDAVLGIYDRDSDVHDTEMKARTIWKYGMAKGVARSPTAFINGVKLDSFPKTTEDWLDILK